MYETEDRLGFNQTYMTETPWSDEYIQLAEKDFKAEKEPYTETYVNATILPPSSPLPGFPWGLGGVVTEGGQYVDLSGIKGAFGGSYPFDSETVEYIDEPIIYIGMVPNHWGHFLIDSVCRLWYILENKWDGKIAFCGIYWKEPEISGNFLEIFSLLGIKKENLLYITEPKRFKEIVIPSPTMSFAISFHEKFKDTVDRIIQAAMKKAEEKNLRSFEKIYFTRRSFKVAQRKEVGEKEVEELFRNNGFQILAPEKLSVVEQIYYIHTCKYMVSMSGTIPHNVIFASKGVKLVILNRTCEPNWPQFLINQLFDVDCTYVDCFMPWMIRHAEPYGKGVIWVGVTPNLKHFLEDNRLRFQSKNTVQRGILFLRQLCMVQLLRGGLLLMNFLPRFKRLLKLTNLVK